MGGGGGEVSSEPPLDLPLHYYKNTSFFMILKSSCRTTHNQLIEVDIIYNKKFK